ncbi:hypothetical protein [Mesorhizobium sp. WSM4904]|uniref:hypothetical protein n=1 Tax=Mesorhizobium sp. WSM4904 TaxID=3038545 RepID=UPI00241829CF|nr:hypothetical protein [Mesorhizobium sp. WSM4904]WFP65498.1 hypothetical protein QAZ47_13595 [Mesorhizobium sp. WSM4904]
MGGIAGDGEHRGACAFQSLCHAHQFVERARPGAVDQGIDARRNLGVLVDQKMNVVGVVRGGRRLHDPAQQLDRGRRPHAAEHADDGVSGRVVAAHLDTAF